MIESSGERGSGTTERQPGCLAVWATELVAWLAILSVVPAAAAGRDLEPRWLRCLPVAAAVALGWLVHSRWVLPRVRRWQQASGPPTWGGHWLRTQEWNLRPAVLYGCLVLFGVLAAAGVILDR